MNGKYTIAAAVATGMLGLAAGLPPAQAGKSDDSQARETAEAVQDNVEYAEAKARDAWLDGKLESALLFNRHLNSFDIDTSVENRTARLRGAVESDIDRDLAGEIAKSVDGIEKVSNELVVDEARARASRESEGSKQERSFRNSVLNATLTARVKSQLLVNGNTEAMAINVDSSDGVVTLSGTVGSEQEKELAERIAGNAAGAKSVQNRLTVETTEAE